MEEFHVAQRSLPQHQSSGEQVPKVSSLRVSYHARRYLKVPRRRYLWEVGNGKGIWEKVQPKRRYLGEST